MKIYCFIFRYFTPNFWPEFCAAATVAANHQSRETETEGRGGVCFYGCLTIPHFLFYFFKKSSIRFKPKLALRNSFNQFRYSFIAAIIIIEKVSATAGAGPGGDLYSKTFSKKWAIPGLFFFIFAFSIELTVNVRYKFLLMTRFEPGTSGFRSDRSTN